MDQQTTHKLQRASHRWFRLPERVEHHPAILRYRNDPVRFKVTHAGRRSFKTEIAKRTLIAEAMSNVRQRYFFGAPTRDQAKRIAWVDLKALSEPVTDSISETDLRVTLLSGSEIWVVGFDKPERFEGTPWHGGILDEYGNMREGVWKENVYPALVDTGGWCWFIGVPEGRNHYYELSLFARSGHPEWADYSWFSSDVIDKDEIEQLRAQYDERTFRQEFEGSFESYEGRAYVYYHPETHRKPQPYRSDAPICIACDFNLDPCLWILSQDVQGFLSFQDEIVQRQADTWRMCNELKARLTARVGTDDSARRKRLVFYGDLEHGKQRSASATVGSWEIIKQEFAGWNVEYRLKPHPRIIDRVNAVNAKLRSADGTVHIGVDPKCRELHKDFEMVSMEDLQKSNDVGDRTHASDAIGYQINFEYPLVGKSQIRTY